MQQSLEGIRGRGQKVMAYSDALSTMLTFFKFH